MNKKSIKSDLKKLDQLTDEEIDYSDIPPLDDSFVTRPLQDWPPGKQQLTVRIDTDVLQWLKQSGPRYQTRLNAILRAMMDRQASLQKTGKARRRTRRRSHAA